MNKKLALITALAVIGVFAAVVVLKSDVDGAEFALRTSRFPRESKNLTRLFNLWKSKHNKTYGGVEQDKRYKIFVENFHTYEKINAKQNSFTVGLNQFSDLTRAEFSSLYLGLKKRVNLKRSNEAVILKKSKVGADSVDWSKKGAVTPLKNQGQCGSCWAFSTTGSLEGLNFIQNGKLLSFSEQQLVDCAGDYGNEGCGGGMMEWALNYTSAKGIELEDSYPYTAVDGTCKYDAKKVAFQNKGFEFANSDSALEKAVTLGPVSVSVEADTSVFQGYTSGVLDSAECGTNLDHGVLAVGFDTTSDGQGYWIVKNSWGASWGNKGYLWIARASGDGICGINMDNAYPTA